MWFLEMDEVATKLGRQLQKSKLSSWIPKEHIGNVCSKRPALITRSRTNVLSMHFTKLKHQSLSREFRSTDSYKYKNSSTSLPFLYGSRSVLQHSHMAPRTRYTGLLKFPNTVYFLLRTRRLPRRRPNQDCN